MTLKIWLKSKENKSIKLKNVSEIAFIRSNLEVYFIDNIKIPSELKNYNKEEFLILGNFVSYATAIDIPIEDISSYIIK